ncbi:MAG: hypothetical protein GY944_09510 [bacterium]|nr:hypothetical protein [bacterium]
MLSDGLDRFATGFQTEFDTLPVELQRQFVLACVDGIEIEERKRLRIDLRAPVGFRQSGTEGEAAVGGRKARVDMLAQ